MFCKWCGLESDTTDICSWCGKPFGASASNASAKADQSPDPIEPGPSVTSPKTFVSPSRSSSGPLNRFVPLGDGFDDLDDDLTPEIMNKSVAPPAAVRASVAPQVTVTPPTVTPPTVLPPAAIPPRTVMTPPTFSPNARPVSQPNPQSGQTPPMEAIPLRGMGGNSPVPPMIPIATRLGQPRPGLPVQPPPPSAAPPVAKQSTAPNPPLARPTFTQPATPAMPPTVVAPIVVESPFSESPVVAPLDAPVDMPPTFAAPVAPVEAEAPKVNDRPVLQPLATVEDEDEPAPMIGGNRVSSSPVASSKPEQLNAPPPVPPRVPGASPVQPPPPRQSSPMVPAKGGRTWYCRWCGMQSEAAEACTWCKKDLRNLANNTGQVHVTTTKSKGGSKRLPAPKPMKKSAPVSTPAPKKNVGYKPASTNGGAAAVQAGPAAAPQLGTFQAVKNKYYSDKVVDPISGAIYEADTGKAEQKISADKIVVEETNDVKQAAINFGILVVLAGLAAVIASKVPGSYLLTMGITCFIAGLIMPLLRSVPFMADEGGDVALAMGLILILGPFVGAIAYVVLGVIRGGDFNPAIVGVFVSALIVRIAVDLGSSRPIFELISTPIPALTFINYAVRSMPLVTLLGWMLGDVFKRHDE